MKLPKSFKKIEAGTLKYKGQSYEIPEFYMYEKEITHLDYREFLHHIQQAGQHDIYEKANFKTTNWRKISEYKYNGPKPMEELYHTHPSYEAYPAVNMTQEGAKLYCEWLSRILTQKDEKFAYEARLPTEQQWVYAAKAKRELAVFPWGGTYLRNSKGQLLCNFRRIGESNISYDWKTGEYEIKENNVMGKAGTLNITAHMPAPSLSYLPNDFGLYNMSGNVAEMLDKTGRTKGGSWGSTGYHVRIDAEDEFEGFTGAHPLIGFRPVVFVSEK